MADLSYRNLTASDASALHDVVSQWSVTRQLGGWPWPPDPAFTANRCKPFEGTGFVWAVLDAGKLVGTIGITGGDLGYMYHPSSHGRGTATQAAAHAITHHFATTKDNRITGSVWYDNAGSARVLQKLGFEHWQTRYERAKARGLPVLVYRMRLTRDRWDSLRTAAQ